MKDKNGAQIRKGDILLINDPYIEYVDVGVGMVPVASLPDGFFVVVIKEGHRLGMRTKERRNYGTDFMPLNEISPEDMEIIKDRELKSDILRDLVVTK